MSARPTWAVVGLGNPGARFDRTRHNVGFRCVDLLASEYDIALGEKRKDAILGIGTIDHTPLVLVKPRTFVNASGAAALYLRQRFGIQPERLLVIYDDMDLPIGTIRIRTSGGSGGHNGLNSLTEALGSQAYPRIRIGVGRPAGNHIAHVLGRFERAEEDRLEAVLDWAVDAVRCTVIEGIESAMNRYN